jgi:hypothetical protein
MVWTVKILDIPPLPKHLHDMVNLQPQMFDQHGTARHEEGRFYQRRLYDETGMHLAATPTCMTAPPEFSQWVNHNIITGWKDVRISYFYKQDSASTGPHTDQLRDMSLIYNIDPGGPNTRLTFWRDKKQPVVRPRGVQAEYLDDLEIIQEIEGPYDCWYLINAHILHSVENLTGTRINVQVSLFDEHEQSILALAKDLT